MNRQNMILLTGCFFVIFTSCNTKQMGGSMITGVNYDEKKNETALTMFPYGNIMLPGMWTKTSYNKVSKQHFLENKDSAAVALTKNPKKKYPFYKSEQSNKDYLTEFTKWESDYFKSQGATISLIDDQSDKGYILWKATIEKENIHTIYLFGLKNDYVYNLSGNPKSWTHEKTAAFLIKLFNDN